MAESTKSIKQPVEWEYSLKNAYEFLAQVIKAFDNDEDSQHREILKHIPEGSWKFLGFAIAQKIAERVKCVDVRLPRTSIHSEVGLAKRSTSIYADWIHNAAGEKPKESSPDARAIYQEFIENGQRTYIIDVDPYNNVRASSGHPDNTTNGYFTTCCQNPNVRLYQNNGQTITDAPSEYTGAFSDTTRLPDNTDFFFSTELPQILRELGLTFACQIEIIERVGTFYIVQFRPQPDQIRRYPDSLFEAPKSIPDAKLTLESIVMTGGCNRENLPVKNVEIKDGNILIDGVYKELNSIDWVELANSCVIVTGKSESFLKILYANTEESSAKGVVIATDICGTSTVHYYKEFLNTQVSIPTSRLSPEDIEKLHENTATGEHITVQSNGLLAKVSVIST